MTNLIALPDGTELAGDYRIRRVLGAGGFGITYLADEIALERPVTIKEYFPADFAARKADHEAAPRSKDCAGDYKWGLDRFIEEAQTLAKFNHPHIVRVYRYFRANNTGYMVLHFEEGQSLKSWLKGLGRAPRQKELDAIVAPLLDALELIHKSDFLHRDIAPDNIIIRKDGQPVLIDFGSARGEIAAHSKTVSALVKPGYSPYEQYAETSRQQGPWTDIYALGATLYHAVVGKRPPDAPSRMVTDEMKSAREAAVSSYRGQFLSAIDRALKLDITQRPQSIAAWRGDLLAPEPSAKGGWLGRGQDKKRGGDDVAAAPASSPTRAAVTHVPPPPDAPGPQGGMLDFMDGLKKRAVEPAPSPQRAAPAPSAAAASAAVAEARAPTAKIDAPPQAPAALLKGRKKKEEAAKPAAALSLKKNAAKEAEPPPPVAAPQPAASPARKPPRPRPVRSGEGSRWRPLLFKLIIGVGVASAAVAVQDRLPRIEQRGGATTSAQSVATSLIKEFKAHDGAVTSLAYAEDGRTLVSGGADGRLKVWNAGAGSLVRAIALDEGAPTTLAVKGGRALTGHASGQVVLWDVERADKIGSFRRNEANVWSVAFVGGQDRFAASAHDWKVALWDAKNTAAPLHVFDGHENAAQALAFASKNSQLASGGADRTVKLWNLESMDLVRTYRGHRDFVAALAFSPDGKTLASASLDGTVRLWSTQSNRLIRTLRGHKGRVGTLAFSPAGDVLVSAGEDGGVRLWDVKSGKTARTLVGHAGAVAGVTFSPDGQRVASAGDDGVIRLWSAALPAKRDKE